MTTKYPFGFLSALKHINFPGKPRILTAEVRGVTPNTGNYTFNGEPFTFFANPPVGPANKISGISLVPGVTGPLGLPTYKRPAPAPTIVSPFSIDMVNRLYAWEQPVPGYISSNQTTGAAILFLDIDNIETAFNNPTSFQFNIQTNSHGSSTPPGPPALTWFVYYDPLGISVSEAATISATENIATQSFLDITVNQSTGDYWIADRTVAADPFGVSNYGSFPSSICSMYGYFGSIFGYPNIGSSLPFGFSSEAEAVTAMAYYQGAPGPPAYPDFSGWPPFTPFTISDAAAVFPWASATPPPYSAACSWSIRLRTWRRATSFSIKSGGTLGTVSIVPAKGEPIDVDPVKDLTLTSHGSNSSACVNLVTVNPGAMTFTAQQKFS